MTTKLESYGRTDRTKPGQGVRRLPNLVADEAGSHLMNFPFAMVLFVLLGGSALMVCIGAFCSSPWTAAAGVTLMLLALGIHGAASVEN